ncbi:MAG: Lrp/AsnC family transcriptional regulator [bacterium]|nr:Lrp/AsnC family transcriptional regulator [bacterium]MDV2478680.1 Lrp/AsnC family transcriptional regulator [bacterium]
MALALILINTEAGFDTQSAQTLQEVKGASDVFLVSGLYDVVATVKGDTAEDVLKIVYNKIRTIEGIEATHTMFCMEP